MNYFAVSSPTNSRASKMRWKETYNAASSSSIGKNSDMIFLSCLPWQQVKLVPKCSKQLRTRLSCFSFSSRVIWPSFSIFDQLGFGHGTLFCVGICSAWAPFPSMSASSSLQGYNAIFQTSCPVGHESADIQWFAQLL